MAKMKLGMKLGAGFASLVLLIAVLEILVFVQLGNIKTDVDRIIQSNIVKMKLTSEAMNALQNVVKSVTMIVAIEDNTFRTGERAAIDKERARYREAMKKLEEIEKNSKGIEILEKTKTLIKAAGSANNKALEFALAGNEAEANSALIEAAPLMNQVLSQFHEMQTYQNGRIDFRRDIIMATYKSANFWLAIAGVAALLVATLAGILITRNITGQLGGDPAEILHAAQAVADGNLSVSIDLSKARAGSVQSSISLMLHNLSKIVTHITESSCSVASAAVQLHGNTEMIAEEVRTVESQTVALGTASEEMAATSADIAQKCHVAAENSVRASKGAESGVTVVSENITLQRNLCFNMHHG